MLIFLGGKEMSTKQRVPISLEFLATLKGMDGVVSKIQSEMKNANFDFGKNTGTAKLFDNYKDEYKNFQSFIKDGSIDFVNSKDAIKSGERLIKMFRDIKIQYGDLSNVSMETAKKLFPDLFSGNIEKAQKYIAGLNKDIESLSSKQVKLDIKLSDLTLAKQKLDKITNSKIAADFDAPIEEANKTLDVTAKKIEDIYKNSKKLKDIKIEVEESKKARSIALGLRTKAGNKLNKVSKSSPEYKDLEEEYNKRNEIYEAANAEAERLIQQQSNIEESLKKKSKTNLTGDERNALAAVNEEYKTQIKVVQDLQAEKAKVPQDEAAKTKQIETQTATYDRLRAEVEGLNQDIAKLRTNTGNLEDIKKTLANFGIDTSDINSIKDAEEILRKIEQNDNSELEKIRNHFKKMGISAQQTNALLEKLRSGLKGVGKTSEEIQKATQEVDRLKQQVLDFFSIGNAIQLFKKAVTAAFNTVKDLDKVMTETAVVTEFNVGDMWSQLPQYTQRANKLGVSIKGAYEAATLYYQQGLKTNEVIGVSNETLKMARIANIEAADATNLMTAALRGFNMEVNEANARNVSDVYSNLAAITAANTKEIGVAMSKTASIAKSANMEFNTTAALLSQIIETTREAPETAGTAMKTIIARFTEVKKLIFEGDLMGTDEEGEVIDVNKIDTALKTVGISLKGFLQGTEGIDDIFLKLASKWDSLDISTQRYIATMAAGSRQQSRFLAMMGDYDRTMELVEEANNSAGASQQQFEKTLDSMESKLAKLKNAWDEFVMGLANNEAIKFFVDILTVLLNVINSITNALSGGGGLSKAFISFAAVLGGFKLGNSILGKKSGNGILGLLGGKEKVVEGATKAGSMTSVGFTTGFKDKINKTKGFFKGFTKQGIKEIKASSLELKGEYDKALKNLEAAQKRLEKAKAEKERVGNIEVTGSPEERKKQGGEKGRASAAANKELAAATDEVAAAEKRVADAGNELAPVTKTIQDGFNQAGAAAAGAGVAFNLLAGLLDSIGADDSTVELFTNIGTALMIVGAIMPIVGKVFVATGGEVAAAGFAAQAGWWWVLAIIAALGVLVAVAVSAAKAAKKASLAGQLEKAQKATENAKEAAEKAKQAYDDLLGEKNKYTELQSSLENLTKGTDAWKQALIDANAQVLNLLATYPKLAQYVSRGEDGQLVISGDGWDSIIKEQEAAVKRTQSAVMSSQVSESRLKKQRLDKNYKEKFKNNKKTNAMNFATGAAGAAGAAAGAAAGPLIAAGLSYLAATTTRDIYQEDAISKGKGVVKGSGSDSDFIYDADIIDKINAGLSNIGKGKEFSNLEEFYESLADSTGKTREELQELVAATNDYNAALLENEVQLQAQAEAALQTGASEEFLNSQYSDSVTQNFAKQMSTTDYSEQEKAASKAIYTNGKGEDDARKKYMEDELNINSSGDELKDLELIYKELAGLQSLDEIPDELRGNKQALADAIGVLQTSNGQIEKMEDFQKRLNKVNKSDADAARNIAGLMSGDASQFTKDQLDQVGKLSNYASQLGYDNAEEMATALGYTSKTLSALDKEDQQAYGKIVFGEQGDLSDTDYQKEIDAWIAENGTASVTATVQMNIDSDQYKAQMEDAYDKASAKLQAKSIRENSYDNLSFGIVKNLSTQVGSMSDEAAQNYVAKFNEVLEKSDLGGTSKKELENYLSSVDWSNMTDAVKAMDYMQEAGIDPTIMKEYWDSATDGAHTFVSTLAEALSLIDRLQGKLSGVTDIADKLSKGTATYEDMNQLIAAGADISGFQFTGEGWRATSEEIETATGLLRTYYAEQASAVADQHAQEFTAVQNLALNNSTTFGRAVEYDKVNGTVTSSRDFANLSDIEQINLWDELQVEGFNSEKETYNEYLARLEQAYNDKIAQLESGDEVQILLEKQKAYTEAVLYTADENALRRGTTDESVRYSMQNEAEAAGLDSTEVTASSEALKELVNQSQQVRDRLALDIALASKAAEEITSNYEDWGAAIKDGPANPKYASALQALTKNTSQLLGVSEDVAAELLKEEKNRDLVAAAARGEAAALRELQKIAAKIIIANITVDSNTTQEELDKISSYIENTEFPVLEVGTSIDTEPAYAAFRELIEGSGLTAEQMGAALESLNFEPQIQWVPVRQAVLSTDQQTYTYTDATGATHTVKASSAVEQDGLTMIPIINGNATVSKPPSVSTSGNKKSGGGGKKETWDNPYDELYNLTEKSNEALRQREKIERDYDRLLKNREATSKQILANSLKEIANLQKEIALQKQLQAGRSSQISKLGSETFKDEKGNEKSFSDWGVTKYASYDETTGTITIDWEAINNITDTEIGAAVEEYISKLEELSEQFEETQDTIEDMEDIIREIQERGKTEYVDFEQRIYDALVAKDQEVIDNLSEINDSINDSNARLLDSIQTAIDEQRQARERDEQRNDIEEKQRRLALLKSDTSGANALEIKALEEEIGDLQQSYTDSLVDDSLAQLQQQNDDAAEQRERQIEIMQNQLDYAAENGAYWEEVSNLLSTAFNPDGSLNNNSALVDLLKETEGFKALSEFGGMQWIDELIESWLVAQEGLANWKIEKAKQSTNGVQTQNAGALKYDSATGLWKDANGGTYSTLTYDSATGQYTASGYTPQTSAPAPTPSPASALTSGDTKIYDKASATSGNIKSGAKGNAVKAIQYALNKLNYGNSGTESVDGIFGSGTVSAVKAFQKAMGIPADGVVGNKTREKFKIKGYLKGGLADYTGPAWMDGTPSKPELVLDAKDTQNFIVLKNILADVFEGHNGVSEKSGDNYFEIHIEVDKLENDYDVEQVAEKVKRVINEDARYRNVNAINVLR